MPAHVVRLVLLVSCAHAMVHVFELALPSVEMLIARYYGLAEDDAAGPSAGEPRTGAERAGDEEGKDVMGYLQNTWRLPFGFGAMLAGWLVDRFGAKWMLVIYLLGCSLTSVMVWQSPDLPMLFVVMFAMGSFASIYHPAGLALISHETTPDQRPMALGMHGILGSAGIASAPFLAGLVLRRLDWQQYYLCLALPGLALAAVIALLLVEHHRQPQRTDGRQSPERQHDGSWRAFFLLCICGMITGFVYAGLMSFLVRYLSGLEMRPEGLPDKSFRNYLTGTVLAVGILGQFIGGRVGRAGILERQFSVILFSNVILLLGMAFAEGDLRLPAAGAVMLVQFMHQPIYNSLVAQYVPSKRRSLGYGFSNMLTFGIGSFGASFAGLIVDDRVIYSGLAALVAVAGGVTLVLARMKRHADQGQQSQPEA